jgi:nucleoside-diphosphate-sugar epimerase
MFSADSVHRPVLEDDSRSLLLPAAAPLLSKPANAVLVVYACTDAGDALISALAASGTCPITAVPHHTATSEWDARMAALGVHVDRSEDCLFAHAARRRLVAAHPRVFIYYMTRFEVMTGNNHRPLVGWHLIDRLLNWLRACHDERARHVVYVSTASPEVFRDRPCLESCHYELEAKLRQLQTDSGIQHFTILRPVSIMTVLVPDDYGDFGKPNPLRVLVRCDPRVQRQFIAAEDVARIAARVLLQGEPFYERTLELCADRLSATQEATLRSEVAQQAVQCDTEDWNSYTSWLRCGVCCAENASWWKLPEEAQRAEVSIAATRALLPELQDYRSWFVAEWKAAQARPAEVETKRGCVAQ